MNNNNSLIMFVLGAIFGAAIGVLYAPKAGRETREDLKKFSNDFSDTVSEVGGDLKSTSRKIYSEGREKVLSGKNKIAEIIEEGKRAFEKYKEED
jgi:gas vesicle protein